MKQPLTIELYKLIDDESAFGNDQGRAIYQKILSILDQHPEQDIIEISLKGIKRTDASFPRESVISLAKNLKGDKGLYLKDFYSRDLMDNWAYAAIAKEQPIIVMTQDGYELLGTDVGTRRRELLDFIMEYGTVTTSKVAEKFDISAQNASAKLKKLSSMGLVLGSKQTAETGGVEFVYRAIKGF